MTNLMSVLVTFIVLTIMFWIMNDQQAERVTKSWDRILKLFPLSQIAKAIFGEKPSNPPDAEP